MDLIYIIVIVASIQIRHYTAECPPTKQSIERTLEKAHIYGAAIIVLNRKEIIYQQGIGYHSPPIFKQRHPIDVKDSIFLLASISKTFIVVAAMQMVESNQLNLDADIHEYLPSHMKIVHLNYPNGTITMRHLLTHTSGLGPNFQEELQHYLPGDTFTLTDLSEVIQTYANKQENWLPVPPGNKTFYSNVATSLAALIIERLAGISFEQYVQDKILKPLGIDERTGAYRLSNFQHRKQDLVDHYIYNTSHLESFQKMVPQLNVTSLGNSSDWFYIPFYGSSIYPAGFLRMSAHSLGLFLQSFLNNFPNILHNSSSINEMLYVFPQEAFTNTRDNKFSLIWNWFTRNGRSLVGHRGSVPGITNLMMANMKRELGVIMLTNGDVTRADNQAQDVATTMLTLTDQLFDCFEKPMEI